MTRHDVLFRSAGGRTASAAGRHARSGFSLIEVIIATAILMGSAIVLAQLAGMGREQSQKSKLYSDAQQLCEQTLNELLLGLRPIELKELAPLNSLPEPIRDVPDQPSEFDLLSSAGPAREATTDETNPEWRHTVRFDVLPDLPGMWGITVIVTQGDATLKRPIRFWLTRWVAGPPPEGAFDVLSRELDEPAQLN